MRHLRAARRTGNHISFPDRESLGAQTHLAFPGHHVEHFLIDPMAVKRAAAHARWQCIQAIAEFLCTELLANPR